MNETRIGAFVYVFFRSSVQDRGAVPGSLHEVYTYQKVGLMWVCVVCGCLCMWVSVSYVIHIILLCWVHCNNSFKLFLFFIFQDDALPSRRYDARTIHSKVSKLFNVVYFISTVLMRIRVIDEYKGVPSRSMVFFSFSCSFQENFTKVVRFWPHLWGWHPHLGNPRSATASTSHVGQISSYFGFFLSITVHKYMWTNFRFRGLTNNVGWVVLNWIRKFLFRLLGISQTFLILIQTVSTRMHSTRMCTVRSLLYRGTLCPRGSPSRRWVSLSSGSLSRGLCQGSLCPGTWEQRQRPPWKEHGTRDRNPPEGKWDQAARHEVASYRDPLPPWTEWQTQVKTLPCPKLRLQKVILYIKIFLCCSTYSSRVLETKHPRYPEGTTWLCFFGWRTHGIISPDKEAAPPTGPAFPKEAGMPYYKGLPESLALGVIGMTGYVYVIPCE